MIGAGLAGLAAATSLGARGFKPVLFEAAGQAGGRCRSYFDPVFEGMIDNGNHLVLSGNQAIQAYLTRIGAAAKLSGPAQARFDFADLKSGARWTLVPNEGPLPWWIGSAARRVPGTSAADYAAYVKLLFANRRQTVADVLPCAGPLWEKLMQPLLLAALNTDPRQASAKLAGAILKETLLRGGRAYRPRIAMPNLAAAFIDPALDYLKERDADVRLNARLRAITFGRRAAAALEFPDATIPLSRKDAVILAVPPWVARELVPELATPQQFRSIVNGHFHFPAPTHAPAILGVTGGTAEWIFSFPDRISVTVSAAEAIVDQDRDILAGMLWSDVTKALDISASLPPRSIPRWQIVKEKRATFAATPAEDARRPLARTGWKNFFLAGDWTDTGLPATIEGAVRSGETAAALAAKHLAL